MPFFGYPPPGINFATLGVPGARWRVRIASSKTGDWSALHRELEHTPDLPCDLILKGGRGGDRGEGGWGVPIPLALTALL
jgi:hypothetical protein